ncbi:hypothetical protein AN958_07460 [Leucoagaricus sp. SymC.cos]|nr:hypothetical protein AN958_07460 [Leucoagaricus sp. SymC.cos]
MRASNLSNHFVLVGPPQVVRNSKSSDTATAYFEVWDSQRGTRAANLVGHSLQFGHWTSRVMEASANPGASLCQRCWRWGHSSQTCHQKMPRDPTRSAGGAIGDVRVFSQNVNRNYMHVDYVLEALKDTYDILFLQELPWRTIRQTVLMTSEEGDDVVGAPKHPDWLYMVKLPTNGQNPHVMAYVHWCLAVLHPSMQRDIIDHHDLFVLSLFTPHEMVNLLNVYSDDAHTAINLLSQDIDQLPAFIYMGSDFNCHSEVWDSSCTSHPLVAQRLLELASDVGLEWARPSNPGLMHIPHNPDLAGSVINLVFTAPSASVSDLPRLDLDQCGPSDHVPISTLVPLSEIDIRVTRMVILRESPEESGFLIDLATGLRSLDVGDLSSSDRIEVAALAVAEIFSSTWNAHAKEITVTGRSRSWWTNECSATIAKYRESHAPGDWKVFHKTSCLAKRRFFNARIEEIAVENQQPWDLMAWVKPRQLPPCEAILNPLATLGSQPEDYAMSNNNSFDPKAFNSQVKAAVLKMPTNKKHHKRKATSPPKPITPGGLGSPIHPSTPTPVAGSSVLKMPATPSVPATLNAAQYPPSPSYKSLMPEKALSDYLLPSMATQSNLHFWDTSVIEKNTIRDVITLINQISCAFCLENAPDVFCSIADEAKRNLIELICILVDACPLKPKLFHQVQIEIKDIGLFTGTQDMAKITQLAIKKLTSETKKPAANKSKCLFILIIKSRPQPRPSVHNDVTLVKLAQAFPALPADNMVSVSPRHKPTSTTAGPNCQQILIPLTNPSNIDYMAIVNQTNVALKQSNSKLQILTAYPIYCGMLLTTNTVPSANDIAFVGKSISMGLKVQINTYLPRSRSYLKVLDISFPINSNDVTPALHINGAPFNLAAKPHIMCNSQHSDTATIFGTLNLVPTLRRSSTNTSHLATPGVLSNQPKLILASLSVKDAGNGAILLLSVPSRSLKHSSPLSALAPKWSYANTVHNITALVNLAKTIPDLPSDHIIVIHQASVPPLPPCRKIKSMVAGPSQCQILVQSEVVVSASAFSSLVSVANWALTKVDLQVDSCTLAYREISLFTSHMVTAEEIQLVTSAVHKYLGHQVHATLPTLWSYLNIVDVPYFQLGTTDPVDSDYVKDIMAKLHMAPSFTLANALQVMRNSAHSDSAMVWFDVIDSQSGTLAKHLINTSF